jgi:GNAT superfamily N-acetyltransferase
VEAAARTDHVNGTNTSPVGYLEGIYVVPSARRHGLARQLYQRVEAWARDQGFREMGSDAGSRTGPAMQCIAPWDSRRSCAWCNSARISREMSKHEPMCVIELASEGFTSPACR